MSTIFDEIKSLAELRQFNVSADTEVMLNINAPKTMFWGLYTTTERVAQIVVFEEIKLIVIRVFNEHYDLIPIKNLIKEVLDMHGLQFTISKVEEY